MDRFTIFYLIIVNLLGLLFMGLDKKHARSKGTRFPEKLLLLIAGIGGSLGIYCGMWIFTHKNRKNKFFIGIPAIIAIQLLIILLAINE